MFEIDACVICTAANVQTERYLLNANVIWKLFQNNQH